MNYMEMNFPSFREGHSEKEVLAMAFVNVQPLDSVYDTERGFDCGTIFPSLNKPLRVGGRGK